MKKWTMHKLSIYEQRKSSLSPLMTYSVFHIKGNKRVGQKYFASRMDAYSFFIGKLGEEQEILNNQLEELKGLQREVRILHFW